MSRHAADWFRDPVQNSGAEMRKAVLCSIAQDQYPGQHSLSHVVPHDVKLVTSACRHKFSDRLVEVPPITNVDSAHMHTITEKLQAAAEQHVQDGDLVILYVGGHGINYCRCWDCARPRRFQSR